jgi:hypothetical protein
MPQYSQDTLESVQSTEEVMREFIPDPIKQYWFFNALQKSLHFDSSFRVQGFGKHLIHYRRKSVIAMFKKGNDYEKIAKSLQIPEMTVRHDIDWYNENK